MLYVVRIERHSDLSSVCRVVLESQEGESFAKWDYMGFFLIYFQTVCPYSFDGFCICHFCLFFCGQEHPEIIHVPDVILYMQLFFDVVVYGIQEGNTGNLDHLRSWIVPGFASVLISQDTTWHSCGIRICIAAYLMFHVLVTYVEIITMYVNLDDPSIRTIVTIVIPQIFLNQFSCKICSLSGLAGTVGIDKTSGHLRI